VNGGFVALLDVLGFSSLVGGDPSGEKIHRYLECLKSATAQSEVDYVVFSDSVVLTAKGDGPESLIAIAAACSRLLADLLNEGIPLRGAIAYGEFFRSRIVDSVFVAGRAVIDAYQFEQAQNWVGVMLAPSSIVRVPDLGSRCCLAGDFSKDALDKFQARIPWAAHIQPCHSIRRLAFRYITDPARQQTAGWAKFCRAYGAARGTNEQRERRRLEASATKAEGRYAQLQPGMRCPRLRDWVRQFDHFHV
jgi:hypothetical protein